jgi:hypothetical protein
MKNPLAVVTLIYGVAATAAAQTPAPTPTPAPSETTGGLSSGEIEIRMPGGGLVVVFPGQGGGTGVAYASIDLVCDDKGLKYTLTTGTKGGKCDKISWACNDGGNHAEASCESGCIRTSGAGGCSVSKF